MDSNGNDAPVAGYRILSKTQNLETDEDVEISEESDDREFDDSTSWTVVPEGSIYDECFISTSVFSQNWRDYSKGLRRPIWHIPCCPIVLSWGFLILNLFIQISVITKLLEVVHHRGKAETSSVVGEYGSAVCVEFSGGELIKRDGQPLYAHDYLQCVPDINVLATQFQTLDLNKDGRWTRDEAAYLQKQYGNTTQHYAATELVYRRLMSHLKQEHRDFTAWRLPNITVEQASTQTGGFTEIPEALFNTSIRSLVDICLLVDPELCSNMEFRQVLVKHLPHVNRPIDRIAICNQAVQRLCPLVFGEMYKFYQTRHHEVCGSSSSMYRQGDDVVTLTFAKDAAYLQPRDGILTRVFIAFLLVVLLIWYLVCLKEFKDVFNWTMVVLFLPGPQSLEDMGLPACEYSFEDQDAFSVKINGMTNTTRCTTLVIDLIPRLILVVITAITGTMLLLKQETVEGLLLDSLALTFIVEIDEIIYRAVVSYFRRRCVEGCSPIRVTVPCCHTVKNNVSGSLLSLASVVVVIIACVFYDFKGPEGKFEYAEAIECFCQLQGPNCLTAQIVGGFASVNEAESANVGRPTAGRSGKGR